MEVLYQLSYLGAMLDLSGLRAAGRQGRQGLSKSNELPIEER
jgi:hypothetical protein